MPWAQVDELQFLEADDARYKYLVLPSGGGQIAWAVSLETTGAIEVPRRRTGFVVPFVGVEDRQVFGPSEEVFRSALGLQLALHHLSYSWLNDYPGLPGRVSGFGVACAPDRGAYSSVMTLWGLT